MATPRQFTRTSVPSTGFRPSSPAVLEVENVVRDGIARGEFREVGEVQLVVELLSGVMRSGAERIGRDSAAFTATVRAAKEIVLASLVSRAD
jgi:hypothetical protein